MDIYSKLEREKRRNWWKVLVPLIIYSLVGYFLYLLIVGNFFVKWEAVFAVVCYAVILLLLIVADAGIFKWMHYDIYFKDGKINIKDGFWIRKLSIPADRIYYISSRNMGNSDYDSLIITDKKMHHKKVKKLSAIDFKDQKEHLDAIADLKYLYPEKTFYYYRVYHHGYKFCYFFYMLYKSCEKCRFSDTSMELVKSFFEQI